MRLFRQHIIFHATHKLIHVRDKLPDVSERKPSFPCLQWETFEPAYDKTYKMACAPSENSDQTGHSHNLIRNARAGSESLLCVQWVAKNQSFLPADSEDSDQTGRVPRLIWVFAWRTCHFVGFVMRWLIFAYFSGFKKISPVVSEKNVHGWNGGYSLLQESMIKFRLFCFAGGHLVLRLVSCMAFWLTAVVL